MNNDLISRQQAFDALHCRFADGFEEDRWWNSTHVIAALKGLPAVPPERKMGHWVEIGDEPYDEWECDVCGFVIDGSGCIDPEEYRDIYRFCPNCGADMRGEQDG